MISINLLVQHYNQASRSSGNLWPKERWCICGRTDAWPRELPELEELNSKRQACSGQADEGRAALGRLLEISEYLLLGRRIQLEPL
jgi:hypothetical protein